MKKFLFLSLSAFLLSGCVSSAPKVADTTKKSCDKKTTKQMPKRHTMKHMKMFQTVDKKDAILLQKGPNKEHCAMCGMNLIKFYKTSHAATLNADKKIQYCSLHCLSDHIRQGVELENPMVVDVKSLKFIPVTEAYYVVGSDVRGTMSMVSKYAFKNLDDAKAFQKKHGGEIMDFHSAWEVAKKDFKK